MIATRDEVDTAALRAWMQHHVPMLRVESSTDVTATRIGGGYSNLTVEIALQDADTVRHLILRRAPVGVMADRGAHDMRREYRVLSVVHGAVLPTSVPVPEPIALCEDAMVIGGTFFLMSRVDGIAVRTLDDAPALRDPRVMRRMSESCIDALAALHALPVEHTSLFDAARVEGYGARQVRNWHARWSAARTDEVPDHDAASVFGWMEANLPTPLPPALLHNDWKFDNLLVDAADPTHINGILDWEMATVGDPRFDLATALGYWVQSNDPPMLQALTLGVTNAPGCLTRQEVVARYAAQRGVTVEAPVFWYVFGVAKVAAIVLQLHARHVSGQVHDARFAALGRMAALLMQTAHEAVARGTLDPD